MNNKITFPELVDLVAQKAGTSKRVSELFLKELFATITQSLTEGDSVKVKGLGTFKLATVNARKSVNVNTGEEIEIPGHNKLTFLPDKELADAVNQPFAQFETETLSDDITDEQLAAIDAQIETEDGEESEPELETVTDETDESQEQPATITPPVFVAPAVTPPAFQPSESEDTAETVSETADNAPATEEEPAEEATAETPEEPVEENSSDTAEDPAETSTEDEEEMPAETAEDTASAAEKLDAESALYSGFDVVESSNEEDKEEVSENSEEETEETTDSEEDDKLLISEKEKRKIAHRSLFEGFIVGVVTTLIVTLVTYRLFLMDPHHESKAVPEAAKVEEKSAAPADTTKKDTAKKAETPQPEEKKAEPKPVMGATQTTDTVRATTTLSKMAVKHYGNGNFWVYIFEENKAKYSNPNNVPQGAILVIPPAAKYGIDKNDPKSIQKAKLEITKVMNEAAKSGKKKK